MIDADLAQLYGVATRVLNQAVRRNLERFPTDFMFQLTAAEKEQVAQLVITSSASNSPPACPTPSPSTAR